VWLRVPENFVSDILSPNNDEAERFGEPLSGGGDTFWDPQPTLLQQALDDLRDGRIEFVVLDAEQGVMQQVAGSGDGPYQLERRASPDAPMLAASGPVDFDLVCRAMHAYLARSPDPDDLQWGQVVAPPPKRGLLKKLFGGS
jgi:hypothetical protein